jgi:hypothetical protein
MRIVGLKGEWGGKLISGKIGGISDDGKSEGKVGPGDAIEAHVTGIVAFPAVVETQGVPEGLGGGGRLNGSLQGLAKKMGFEMP